MSSKKGMSSKVEQISEEIAAKGYKLVSAEGYRNMNCEIVVECSRGHKITTTFAAFRKASFRCPECEHSFSLVGPNVSLPQKNGYRVVALDQSSKITGISVWDNSKLVYYQVLTLQGDVEERLRKFYDFLNDVVIKDWRPDFMAFEDIQLQEGNVLTYKTLAMILGICVVSCSRTCIPFSVTPNLVWQKEFNIAGGKRIQQKKEVIKRVSDFYGLTVTDDAADAILLGKYVTTKLSEKVNRLF